MQDTLWLEQLACSPASIPTLEKIEEGRYALPAQPLQVNTFKGERFNQKELEQQLRKSNSFAQMMRRSELDSGAKRPLLPLSISQIGLAFEMEEVTPEGLNDICRRTESSWIAALAGNSKKAQTFRLLHRTFF